MHTVKNWSSLLIAKKHIQPVPPVRSLRPGDENFIQYIDSNGSEIVVVRSLRPYGFLTDTAFTAENQESNLLHAIESREDYVSFELPVETIALKALTLGTGGRHAQLLTSVYERVGKAVANVATQASLPKLGLGDFAVRRETGEVAFIPPIEFGVGSPSATPFEGIEMLASRVQDGLSHAFNPQIRQMLGQALIRGYES